MGACPKTQAIISSVTQAPPADPNGPILPLPSRPPTTVADFNVNTTAAPSLTGQPPEIPGQQGLPPVWRADARILLLGSFPGNASLAARAYYAHPRNQFWPILGALLGLPLPALPYAERLQALRTHRIALWDVVGHCRRQGSLDANIRDAVGNEFDALLKQLPELALIAFNGQRAARRRRAFSALGYQTVVLPSSSPAHASRDPASKLASWRTALAPWLPAPGPPGGPAGQPPAGPAAATLTPPAQPPAQD